MDIFKSKHGEFVVLNGAHSEIYHGLESLLSEAHKLSTSNFASAFYYRALLEGLTDFLKKKLEAPTDFNSVREKYANALFGGNSDSVSAYWPQNSGVADFPGPVKAYKVRIGADLLAEYNHELTSQWEEELASIRGQKDFDRSTLSIIGPEEKQIVFPFVPLGGQVYISSWYAVRPGKSGRKELTKFYYKDGKYSPVTLQNLWIYRKGTDNGRDIYDTCKIPPDSDEKDCRITEKLSVIRNYNSLRTNDGINALVDLFSHFYRNTTQNNISKLVEDTGERNGYCHRHITAFTNQKFGKVNRWEEYPELNALVLFVRKISSS